MKKLFLLVLLLPAILLAQPAVTKKNGTYTIDFSKKKKAPVDSTKVTQTDDEEVDEDGNAVKVKGKKKPHPTPTPTAHKVPAHKPYNYDFKTDGVFKGLFTAGLNACQIDGDDEWGYKYFGAEVGVGALARFHNFFSTSVEIEYTMKGARARLTTLDNPNFYQVQYDYLSVPVALNFHAKELAILSLGLAPGVMTRFKQFNQEGINVTTGVQQPKKVDLDIFTEVHFVIKKHYALGLKYSYSLIRLRDGVSGDKIQGQYNNVLTLRFMYILGPIRKNK